MAAFFLWALFTVLLSFVTRVLYYTQSRLCFHGGWVWIPFLKILPWRAKTIKHSLFGRCFHHNHTIITITAPQRKTKHPAGVVRATTERLVLLPLNSVISLSQIVALH